MDGSNTVDCLIRGIQHDETRDIEEQGSERGATSELADPAEGILSHNATSESPRGKKTYTHPGPRLSTLTEFGSAIDTLGDTGDQHTFNGRGSFQSDETVSYPRGTSFISSSGTSSNNSSYHPKNGIPRNFPITFLPSNLNKENHPNASPISTSKSEDFDLPPNRNTIETSPNGHSFYTCNPSQSTVTLPHNRDRLNTDESNAAYDALVAAHTQQSEQREVLKFYDSDADTENESVIYNAQMRVGSYQTHLGSLGGNATGRMESGMTDNSRLVKSGLNVNVHGKKSSNTPHPNNLESKKQNVSNLSQKNPKRGGYSKDDSNAVLPYHKRILLARDEAATQEQRENDSEMDQHHLNHSNQRIQQQPELSTISKPLQSTTSPPKLEQYSHSPTARQLPPSGATHQQNNRNYNAQGHYQRSRTCSSSSFEEDSPPSKIKPTPPPPRHPRTTNNNRSNHPSRQNRLSPKLNSTRSTSPPTRHIRADSGGSISSLGSLMGGASSISKRGGKTLVDQLQNDIKSFLGHSPRNQPHQHTYEVQDNIIENPEDFYKINRRQSREGSGFLSSILGSMSVSSAGSGYQSLDEDMEDFHEKNQAFLQKAERDRVRQQRSIWGGEKSGENGKDFSYVSCPEFLLHV